MARPCKPRRCPCCPKGRLYKPAGIPGRDLARIHIAEDEFEALILCDLNGLSQAQAGERMGVSRGTIQRLTERGRKKLISALNDGCALLIGEAETKGSSNDDLPAGNH